MTIYYTSNDPTVGFDATASGALPTDWTAAVGTWKVGTVNPVGAHAQSFGSTTGSDGDVALLTGIAAQANMQVSFTQVIPNGFPGGGVQIDGPILRSDSGYNNCYTVLIDTDAKSAGQVWFSFFKRVGGSYSQIGTRTQSAQTFSSSGATTLNIIAQINGTSLSAMAWQTGTTQPASWDYTLTDASISAAGYAGLYNGLDSVGPSARGVCDFTVADSSGDAETIIVTTPATESAGASFTYSGTYTGTQPAALDFQFDSAGWSAAATPAIGGGTWSFTATAPAAGTHTLSVRDHTVSSVAGTSGSFTTTGGETISVTTPGTETAGSSFTYSGSYTGGPPTALDYQFDSAGWSAAASPTIGGGTWSFSATAPAAGSHTLSVRDHNNTGVSGSSGSFSTTTTASISVATPGGLIIAGQALTVSGTYSGTAPTGLNYHLDSASYVAASGPTIGGGNWSFSITAPAFGGHTITVQEANATAVTTSSGSFTVAAAPNNAAIVYSPYGWNVGAAAAITINAGAYFKTLFSGASCTLNFNVANMCSPASELWWRVDDGPPTQAAVAAMVAVTIPAATAGNADVPYHLLEVMVKSTTETANRWNSVGAATGTAVIFQGLTLATGAALVAPLTATRNLLIYGDSITEGVRTLGESATNDTDRNDASMCWSYRLAALLGTEVGIIGFGATGLSVTGSGNVPMLGSSYALLYGGVARPFSPAPDMVIFNIGSNDGSTNTIAAMTGVLNGIIAACPGAIIVVLRPFDGNQAGNLQAAIAACGSPAACHYVDTTGYFNTSYGSDSLNMHPSGPNGLGLVAPQLAAQLKPLLDGSHALVFRGGFQRGLLG